MTKVKLYLILTFLLITGGSMGVILHAEQEKRLRKYAIDKQYYADQYNSWLLYKNEYLAQLKQLQDQNANQMKSTKEQYDKLMAEQDALIKQHTRVVAEGTQTDTGTNIGAVSSTKQQVTQTIKVQKPVSKPKTRTS